MAQGIDCYEVRIVVSGIDFLQDLDLNGRTGLQSTAHECGAEEIGGLT